MKTTCKHIGKSFTAIVRFRKVCSETNALIFLKQEMLHREPNSSEARVSAAVNVQPFLIRARCYLHSLLSCPRVFRQFMSIYKPCQEWSHSRVGDKEEHDSDPIFNGAVYEQVYVQRCPEPLEALCHFGCIKLQIPGGA